MAKQQQLEIIKDVCQSTHSKAMACHKGRDSTYSKIYEHFFWYSIYKYAESYIKSCENSQKQDLKLKTNSKLHSLLVPLNFTKQAGVDLCGLPENDGYYYRIVCIDCFSKWSEAKLIKDKTAPPIAQILYNIMCRHGCFAINDQGKEFVNEVSDKLHLLTHVQQLITSAYHPQSSGLVERENRTRKDSLMKVLEENILKWPSIIEGVFLLIVSVNTPLQSIPNSSYYTIEN